MANIALLRGKMVERAVSPEALAKRLNIDKSTLYRRLSREGESFTVREANLIVAELQLTKEESMAIFFA